MATKPIKINRLIANKISGSLTQLDDGTSYLIAGSNIEITSGSNGAVTITGNANVFTNVATSDGDTVVVDSSTDTLTFSGAGGITVSGTADTDTITIDGSALSTPPGGTDTMVQFNQNNTFAGDATLTFDATGSLESGAKLFLSGVFLAHRGAAGGLQTDERWTKVAAGSGSDAQHTGSFAQGYASYSDVTSRIVASLSGSFAQGVVFEAGPSSYWGPSVTGYGLWAKGRGTFAQGYAIGPTSGVAASTIVAGTTTVLAGSNGSFAQGYAKARGYVRALGGGLGIGGPAGGGSFAQGYAGGESGSQYYASIYASQGSFAQGNASLRFPGYSPNHARIRAYGGSFAQGLATDYRYRGPTVIAVPPPPGAPNTGGYKISIYAVGGSFAQGWVAGHVSSIDAVGGGSFAQGLVGKFPASPASWSSIASSSIRATGAGSFARGYVSTDNTFIKASGDGSFASGKAGGNYIYAYGAGSVALGSSTNGAIYAYGDHAFQLGPGRNDHYSSFQIGDVTSSSGIGIRVSSTKPASTGPGDLFLESDRLTTAGDFASSGSVEAVLGLSGSLTKLVDGTSYLIAGSNITIASTSNGPITISSTGGGGGTPGGADTMVQFNQNGAFAGDVALTFDATGSIESGAKLFFSGAFLAHRGGAGGLQTDERWTRVAAGTAKVRAYSTGSFAQGYVHPSNASYGVSAFTPGSFSQGWVDSGYSYMQACSGSFAQGISKGGGLIIAGHYNGVKGGSFAQGFANAGTINARHASKGGQFAQGYVRRGGDLRSWGAGSFTQGYCDANNSVLGYIKTDGWGTFAQGYAAGSNSRIMALSFGSFAQGAVNTGASLRSTNVGSFVHGAAKGSREIEASSVATFAQGYAASTGHIRATSQGAFARGYALNASIRSTGQAAFSHGKAQAAEILASGKGSVALGYASTTIVASADHAMQLGPGTNARALSIRAGEGVRITEGTTGLVTGDIGKASGNDRVLHVANPMEVSGSIQVKHLSSSLETLASADWSGEAVYFGLGSVTSGLTYFLDRTGTWTVANAATGSSNTKDSLLGLALGTGLPATVGLLTRGFVNVPAAGLSGSFLTGSVVYINSASQTSEEGQVIADGPPTNPDSIIRVVGHFTTQPNVLYFNPSGDFFVV